MIADVTADPLDLPIDEMRAMADQVVARCLEHLESLPSQQISGDVDAGDLCRAMREPAPEHGTALAPLLDSLFHDWIPRSFTTPGPGYLAYIPGGGLYPAALADFISNTVNRYTGVWQAAPALVQLEANALDCRREAVSRRDRGGGGRRRSRKGPYGDGDPAPLMVLIPDRPDERSNAHDPFWWIACARAPFLV
jgi:hypothetical protein